MGVSPSLEQHETVRAAFPALQEVVYLNVGTYGIMPAPALEVFLEAMEEHERFGVACRRQNWKKYRQTRDDVAKLLGCQPEQVTFTGNATDGTNLVLAGLAWQEGDEIITTDEEHEAIIHPLLYLQRSKGVRMRRISVSPDPEVMLARCEEVASPRTRLIAFSHVTCETGTRLPAKAICDWAAERGIWSHVDGAQSLSVFRMSVQEMGCDSYTSNGHKWLSGPKGTGIFYASPERMLELSPAHVGAGSLERADVETGEAELWPTGRRFEFGTRASVLWIGLGASLEWLSSLGYENIEQYIAKLSGYFKDRILERPYMRLLTPRAFEDSSGLTTFAVNGRSIRDVGKGLREWRIPIRGIPHYDAIRISTAHFNNEADIDTLMTALDQIMAEPIEA